MKQKTPCGRRLLSVLCNMAVGLASLGIWLLMLSRQDGGFLSSAGIRSLRYFTVLSNLFNGAACLAFAMKMMSGKPEKGRFWLRLKLMAVSSVALTFLTVACFLGPIYGYRFMYLGGNLWFHLLLPLLSMISFCLFDLERPVTLRDTLWSMLPPLLYGSVYTLNLLINGVGQWPNTNDWYGFLNWGWRIGFGIFGGIVLAAWAAALLLRLIGNRTTKTRSE